LPQHAGDDDARTFRMLAEMLRDLADQGAGGDDSPAARQFS
jgi:hypothetical protein